MDIQSLVQAQRSHFQTGAALGLTARRTALKRLGAAIRAHERDIIAALMADLNKSSTEGYMCEVGLTLSELSFVEKRLARWMRDRNHLTPLAQFPARSFTVQEPYGVVLIMSPWNYPFLLTMEPLIGAIAAGNCCVVKPSAYSPATSAVIRDILSQCFPPEYVAVVEGGRAENQALLDQKFDYIFFTGGTAVGKEVMSKAAKHLTPVTLELGGKSPCIVDATARLELAAKRIVFGKLLNCGQTCVAPDYLLIDRRVKNRFLAYVKRWITVLYGSDPLDNKGYVRMVNRKHFDRVMGLINPAQVVFGGQGDPAALAIQPTILDPVSPPSPGPLPVLPGPGGPGAVPAPGLLRRRVHQRHHHPSGHQPHGLRRRGGQRHGQLPRQSQLRRLLPPEEHRQKIHPGGPARPVPALYPDQSQAAAAVSALKKAVPPNKRDGLLCYSRPCRGFLETMTAASLMAATTSARDCIS